MKTYTLSEYKKHYPGGVLVPSPREWINRGLMCNCARWFDSDASINCRALNECTNCFGYGIQPIPYEDCVK